MLQFVGRRFLILIPTLFVVSIIVFGLQKLLPGDPAIMLAGENMDENVIAEIRRANNLDRPVVVQYGLWLGKVLQGDLGISLRNQVTVTSLIAEKLPATGLIALLAMIWAIVIGIP